MVKLLKKLKKIRCYFCYFLFFALRAILNLGAINEIVSYKEKLRYFSARFLTPENQ